MTRSYPEREPTYLPTPEEIERVAEEVRKTWSKRETEKRTITKNPPAAIHTATHDDLMMSPDWANDAL